MSNETDTNKIAKEKAQKALRLIEKAQNLLSEACAELSPIVHGAKQYDMVGDHYDRTKDLWRTVNETIPWGQIDLDSDAKSKLIK